MKLEYSMMKKKILFVINTLGGAGAEHALLTLLRTLEEQNCQAGYEKYEISLYVLLGQGELAEELPPSVRLLNRNYKCISVLEKQGRFHMYQNIVCAMCRRATVLRLFPEIMAALLVMLRNHKIWPDKLLWRVLSDGAEFFSEEYDLAVAFLEGGSSYYVADHVKAKKKAAFIHIDYTQAGYTRKLDHECYLRFDVVFPISDEVKTHFLKVYPECANRTSVFHNIIDQKEIRKKAELPGGFSDDFDGIRILTVGRLSYQKAYPIAIEAMRLLKQEQFSIRWYVLGEGSERSVLERQIKEAGLEQDFILAGAVRNPYPYYRQADIYVHATRFEGKSIAIQEAQALGCAIIASDSNGNREQIRDGVDGTLCDLSAAAIKNAILDLIENEEKRKRFAMKSAQKKVIYEDDIELLDKLLTEDK